jgi:hypothetical protein
MLRNNAFQRWVILHVILADDHWLVKPHDIIDMKELDVIVDVYPHGWHCMGETLGIVRAKAGASKVSEH